MERLTIDPITRLEGHGKIEIFLDDKGEVEEAYLQVPELRGFETFCRGRRAELMPQLTSRICGVCPVAHHMASTKALDMAFKTEPPPLAHKLRELLYMGYIIYDHILHFYFLAAPDFIVGPTSPKEKRNILGILEKIGVDTVKMVIKHRAYGQKITEILGGKATHPVSGLPGGVTKGLNGEEKKEIENMAKSCLGFAQETIKIFKNTVLMNKDYKKLITSKDLALSTYNMGLVDKDNKLNFYRGRVRVTAPDGSEFLKFDQQDYRDLIAERVLPWSYVKVPYLKKVGWNDLTDGFNSGLYRVGPLGRLNAADGLNTPLAQKEFEKMIEFFGGKPINNTLAYHWARVIEILNASERAVELITDDDITGEDLKNPIAAETPGRGVGIVEAARGTLIHDYTVDENDLIKDLNLIVATTNNNGVINMAIRQAASKFIHKGKYDEGIFNMVEMFFRAFDPCMACASHQLGKVPLEISIKDKDGNIIDTITNFKKGEQCGI